MGKDDAILYEKTQGVINPPPEVKKIIDKAAGLVAKYGSNIEAMMRKEDKNLPKFSFLKEGDPYRPYYEFKVNQLVKESEKKEKEMLSKKVEAQKDIQVEMKQDIINEKKNFLLRDDIKKMINDMSKTNIEEKNLPQDQFIMPQPNITPLEIDIIKTTAQFVARNGQRFLTGLSEREAKNSQYDFLKPQHFLFGYFTTLVEQYSKCLLQRKDDIAKLNSYANDKNFIIKKAVERYLIEKKLKENLKKKNEINDEERAQMMQIDWNEFVILETIDFTEEELRNTVPIVGDINVNANISSLESNISQLIDKKVEPVHPLIQPTIAPVLNPEIKQQFKEPEILLPESKRIEEIKAQIKQENVSKPEPGMKIVKNYVRKTDQQKENTSKCPLCNEYINVDDLVNHMKIELLDPKWKEINKELMERKNFNATNTDEFLNNLQEFSKFRPDLFGDGKKPIKDDIEIEDSGSGPIWSGFAPNMSRTTANIAMLNVQNRKNIDESRKIREGVIHQINPIQPVESNKPESNKQQQATNINIKQFIPKKEEKGLLTEDTWLKKHPVSIVLI